MDFQTLDTLIHLAWILGAALFVLGLHQMNSPATARQGNQLSAVGMTIAVVGAVILIAAQGGVQPLGWPIIIVGVVIGGGLGLYTARTVKMTAMPQLVSIFNGVGGGAAALIAIDDYIRLAGAGGSIAGGQITAGGGDCRRCVFVPAEVVAEHPRQLPCVSPGAFYQRRLLQKLSDLLRQALPGKLPLQEHEARPLFQEGLGVAPLVVVGRGGQLGVRGAGELVELAGVSEEGKPRTVDRVWTEEVQKSSAESQSNHRCSRHAARRHHTDVRSNVSRLNRLIRIPLGRAQRAPQSRDRLQVPAHHDVFAVRDAAFESAGVVRWPRESPGRSPRRRPLRAHQRDAARRGRALRDPREDRVGARP